MIVAKRQQPLPTAKAAFAGGSGETSHTLNLFFFFCKRHTLNLIGKFPLQQSNQSPPLSCACIQKIDYQDGKGSLRKDSQAKSYTG